MKCFLWKQKQIFSITRKEEIDKNTYLISDYEEAMIEETLANDGELWLEDNQVKWSGKRPGTEFDWDKTKNDWVVNKTRADEKLKLEQDEVWEKIKEKRDKELLSGVNVASVGLIFQTDDASITKYNQYAAMINLGNYEPVNWKTSANDIVKLTPELLKEVLSSILSNSQRIFRAAEIARENMLLIDNPLEFEV